jgi:hypothetical protein
VCAWANTHPLLHKWEQRIIGSRWRLISGHGEGAAKSGESGHRRSVRRDDCVDRVPDRAGLANDPHLRLASIVLRYRPTCGSVRRPRRLSTDETAPASVPCRPHRSLSCASTPGTLRASRHRSLRLLFERDPRSPLNFRRTLAWCRRSRRSWSGGRFGGGKQRKAP